MNPIRSCRAARRAAGSRRPNSMGRMRSYDLLESPQSTATDRQAQRHHGCGMSPSDAPTETIAGKYWTYIEVRD